MPNRKAKKSTKTGRSQASVKHSFRKKDFVNELRPHGHFMGILTLFVVISLFSILSFWDSTNDYIDHVYTTVSYNDSILVDGVDISEGNEDTVQIFTDVSSNHINNEAIEFLYYQGLIKGYDDGTFQPDNPVNRAEFMVIVTNVVDADFGGLSLENCCTDVSDEWYATFMCYGKQEGWIKGYEDGSCRPENNVTKAEALKIAYEAMDLQVCETVDTPPYADVAIDDWFAPYACAARKDGVLYKAGQFNGNTALTRGEVAQIIYNMIEFQIKFFLES